MVIMEAYAVVETGGKQYRVEVGKTFDIERLTAEAGSDVEISEVLAVSDGKDLKIGAPFVEGAKVVITIVDDSKRGVKVVNFKKRKRKGYERKVGHRQELTTVTVKSIA
jgi:large subunit ribosomal protein L21